MEMLNQVHVRGIVGNARAQKIGDTCRGRARGTTCSAQMGTGRGGQMGTARSAQ